MRIPVKSALLSRDFRLSLAKGPEKPLLKTMIFYIFVPFSCNLCQVLHEITPPYVSGRPL